MGDKEYKYIARKVSRMMDEIPGWERMGVSKHAQAIYGVQKSFRRTHDDSDDEDI
jgi:hypothetical protein